MNVLSPTLFQPRKILSRWQMYEIEAKEFVCAVQALMALERVSVHLTQEEIEKEESYKDMFEHLANLKSSCDDLSANLTVVAIDRFIESIAGSKVTFQKLDQFLKNIRERLTDELEEAKLFALDKEYQDYYYGTYFFLDDSVLQKFSSPLEEDLDEAAKCLALARGTACVFHLMRAMEEAVKVLGTKLGIQNVEKEWGKILSDIGAKIEVMPKGQVRDEWSACHVNLYHVKQAWRNATMHPKETYTVEQAKEVTDAVHTFLRQLATLV
jgi:hypothetical protein